MTSLYQIYKYLKPERNISMKITAIETYADISQCLVRVCTDMGEGWGMTAPFSADITAQILHRLAAPQILGKEIQDFKTVGDEIIREGYKFTGSFLARTASGIDTALWDLMAKAEGKSVADFAGRKRTEPVKLYGSSMQRNPQTLQMEADRLLSLHKKYGFEAFKLHTGIPVGNDQDIYPGCTEDFVQAVRKTLPSGIGLWVDVNGNFTAEKAIEMGKFLKDNGVDVYEEPCPYWLLHDVKMVRDACAKIDLPIAAGEQDFMETQWDQTISNRVIDIAQPDILYIGGFSRALRIAEKCAAAGIPSTPHTSNRSPIFVFGLHFMSVIDLPQEYMECGIEDDIWQNEAYLNQPQIKDGKANILEQKGWGLEINQEWLKRSLYQVSKI